HARRGGARPRQAARPQSRRRTLARPLDRRLRRKARQNKRMRLIYIADPMCSWCYGFGPELAKLLARHADAELELVMGGLRPFNTQPATAEFREMLRGHWRHVATASGLPFSDTALDRPGFVYDTEPACRAVVTARDIEAAKAPGYMKAVQAAFYRDGRDVTRGDELADIAAECGFE